MFDREETTCRLDAIEAAAEAGVAQMALQFAEVGRNARADIGIGSNRRDAFELAIFLREFVGGGDEGARQFLKHDLLDAHFVRGIAIGVQQQDCDSLDAAILERADERPDCLFIERLVHGAIGAQSLGHFEAHGAANERLMLAEEEIVGVGTIDAADLVDVAEAFRDQQGRLRAVALQQCVDGDRRTMKEEIGILRLDLGNLHGVLDATDELSVGRERLAEVKFACVFVEGCEVGEGAADVDGNAKASRAAGRCVSRHDDESCVWIRRSGEGQGDSSSRACPLVSVAKRMVTAAPMSRMTAKSAKTYWMPA